MRDWFAKWFVAFCLVLSFYFVIRYYYKIKSFEPLALIEPSKLFISFLFLFAGLICQMLTWHVMLKLRYKQVTVKQSFASAGVTVFTKYIPGKILSVLSRSKIISNHHSLNFVTVSGISLQTQLIILFTGLLLGFLSLQSNISSYVLISIAILLVILFLNSKYMTQLSEFISRRTGRQIELVNLKPVEIVGALPVFIIYWLLLCCGFYYFVLAFLPFSFAGSFSFALAATSGILAIFSPGGLVVREGILFVYLQWFGIDAESAITISIMSRLWFMLGEAFIFLVGLACRYKAD